MSSCPSVFPGVRSSLVFSGFGLKPPDSGFESYFYSSLKTSPSISHEVMGPDAKASIPTLKLSTTQEQTSFRARHTKLILQQRRKINLSTKIRVAKSHTKPTDNSKLTTGHFIALQREEIQLHPPEHRHKLP